MQVFHTIKDIKKQLKAHRQKGESIGLVPTMGFLHDGHAQLIRECISYADVTVCSIFVNPTQFNNSEDLENYPTSLEKDLEMLRKLGCSYVFHPSAQEMYPHKPEVTMEFGHFDEALEGTHRPGHFAGVGLVVTKLLNIIQPDAAFFGRKDLQQLKLVERLVEDLNLPAVIRAVPTVRESSGLALSSRNARLSALERESAANLYRALQLAREKWVETYMAETALSAARNFLKAFPVIELEYMDMVYTESFAQVKTYSPEEGRQVAICAAAWIGKVRLIDNVEIGE